MPASLPLVRRVATATLLTMLIAQAAVAQLNQAGSAPARPDVAPGVPALAVTMARELASAVTSPDSAPRAALVARWFPDTATAGRAEALRLLTRLHEQGSGVELVKLEPAGGNTFITVRALRQPRLVLLNAAWSKADSTKLGRLEPLKAWHPAADSIRWPEQPLSSRELLATLDENIARLARIGAYSGTVLVAAGDSVIFTRGYGWANLDDSIPNRVDTRYTTASMGKMFTAVAIGQLIEAGKLHLDDTLGHVLPDYPNAERARRITIRQLLSHTAGLGEIWDHPAFVRGRSYTSNRELAWAIANAPLRFAPGTRWSYSNEGFVVLGTIIERVSGMTFEDYMRARVWGPAGMRGVANVGSDAIVPHRAVGYAPADDDILEVEPQHPHWPFLGPTSRASGAGGEYATVTDYFRFVEALRHDKLLSRAMRDTLWTGRHPLPWDAQSRYGFGFIRMNIAGHDYVGHGGGGGYGIDNMLYASVNGRYTVVVLGNRNPPGATDLAAIARFLARASITVTNAPARDAGRVASRTGARSVPSP
jgi:CubicO group peptidase (beta-lactamase class C family)